MRKRIRYCDKQVAFLVEYFKDSPELTPEYRKHVEDKFQKTFGFFRSSEALRHKARKLSLRPLQSPPLTIGKTISENGDGKKFLILTGVNPSTWTTVDRYKWEKETKEKLTENDIIINLKGVVRYPEFEDLRKVTRSEFLKVNKLSSDIPIETRILIAKIEDRSAVLVGQGPWSDCEIKYLEKFGKTNGNVEFWKEFTKSFNLKFKKNRRYRQVLSMYYNKVGRHEKL